MALTLSRRILRFNFDPSWFAHPIRLSQLDLVGAVGHQPSVNADEALQSFGLAGRWCFDFAWQPGRLVLLSSQELDWVCAQLAILALPEFRTLVVRRDDRDWILSLPASKYEATASVGDVFRDGGELRPATGMVKDIRTEVRRHGAALWSALGHGLGESAQARMALMLDPALEYPRVVLSTDQLRLLHHGFVRCLGADLQRTWSWVL